MMCDLSDNFTHVDKLKEITARCWSPHTIVYDPLQSGSIDGTDCEAHDKAISRAQNSDYFPNKRVKGISEHTIFVGRLDYATKEETLKYFFEDFGKILRCTIVRDLVSNRSKGYGFVEFESEVAALTAFRRCHKARIDGRQIIVDMECGRVLPGWKPRRLGGGFGGKKESGQLRFGGRDRPFRKPISLYSEKDLERSAHGVILQ